MSLDISATTGTTPVVGNDFHWTPSIVSFEVMCRYAEPADRCEDDGCPLYGPEVMARLGIILGSYKIHSILGEGGMGVVYRGEHVMLRKPVAIKILHERFARREAHKRDYHPR